MMELIFEKSRQGSKGYRVPEADVPECDLDREIPPTLLRKELDLPELAEVDVVRHYTALSRMNFGVDTGFYPLGSCTMKYNPKINEDLSRLPGFEKLHPYAPVEWSQGALKLMYELKILLCEIFGMADFSLQPAAGAHGELTGMMICRKYFEKKKERRTRILIPDTAHGTNPASGALGGFEVLTVPSDAEGNIDLAHLRQMMTDEVAALMLTNPNTLGLFERHIEEIADIVHVKGGILYGDGANANAFLGRCRPGDLGFDLIQINLHKTFSSPHGAGGPGSGPVGVAAHLVDFLPGPQVVKEGDTYALKYDLPDSIGRVRSFYGNFAVFVRAYAYIRALGAEGLKKVADMAVLNANYVRARLKPFFDLPYDRICMHECVFSGRRQLKSAGVRTAHMAKRLIDYGFHPPTVYFPLIVPEAMMIEPTETESLKTLDEFCEAMIAIAREAEADPNTLRQAPLTTPLRHLDEVLAAREPDLAWKGKRGNGE
ncbi:MAG TPA: aminomethyl-transferring glycine dehydrogenase subunit GcvPB [Syntrophales bacterium]|nr:aminomethyl-transferring glycine dehydrogenase subunit GcvPB [Syntrophales bacterium]HOL59003.1 aminomethyl-transferring glycine dehydrogenase subunit GcvPB [Syntrophales bacterium]HPO34719.1 aminomethyl-transferring glycine dehydrogenase subunit GcvPB [Syntrophales bacterium]